MKKYIDYVFAGGAKLVNFSSMLLISVVLTNLLGLGAYGEYVYYMSFMSVMFMPFSSTAIQWTTRAVASQVNITSFKFMALCYSVLCLFTSLLLVHYGHQNFELIVAILIGVSFTILNIQIGTIRGLGLTNRSIYIEVLAKAFLPIIMFLTMMLLNVEFFLLEVLIAQLAIVVLFVIYNELKIYIPHECIKLLKKNNITVLEYIQTVLATSIPLLAVEIIVLLTTQSGSFEDAAAFRIGIILSSAISFTLTIVNAKESYKFASLKSEESFTRWKLYLRFTKLAVATSVPVYLLINLILTQVIAGVWGEQILQYEGNFRLIILAGMLNVLFGPIGMVLLMSNQERILITAGIISMIPIGFVGLIGIGGESLDQMCGAYLLHVILLNTSMLFMSLKGKILSVSI